MHAGTGCTSDEEVQKAMQYANVGQQTNRTVRRGLRMAFSLLSRHEQIVTFKTLKFQFLGFNGLLGSRFQMQQYIKECTEIHVGEMVDIGAVRRMPWGRIHASVSTSRFGPDRRLLSLTPSRPHAGTGGVGHPPRPALVHGGARLPRSSDHRRAAQPRKGHRAIRAVGISAAAGRDRAARFRAT